MRRRRLAIPLALLIALAVGAGCAPAPPVPYAALPPDSVDGAGDPTRGAILGTAYAFGTPASLAGRPAEAARAVARFEYLAVELPTGPRWVGMSRLVGPQFAAGREEIRGVLGIPSDAPPQAVIEALFTASRALRAGDVAAARAALEPPLFQGGGAATLARLANLPPLPRASVAASFAQQELIQQDQDRGLRSFRGGGVSLGLGLGFGF